MIRRTDPMILIETEALTDFRFSIHIFGEQINESVPLILVPLIFLCVTFSLFTSVRWIQRLVIF